MGSTTGKTGKPLPNCVSMPMISALGRAGLPGSRFGSVSVVNDTMETRVEVSWAMGVGRIPGADGGPAGAVTHAE